ncbi:helicase-associated domain-containing protein [Lapillicoccus sp.]|uniref:helicase-associated domain-containing protein n=1 Tax=Lapillicoccus sp. TaxID=1909287 RepID=UPI003267544F
MSTTPAAALRGSAARSLADDIRGRTDAELTELLLRRPDLARPAPSDLTSLAARAGTRASVQRCIESLDRAHLQVLEAVLVTGDGSTTDDVGALLDDTDVSPQVDRLWALALVWRASDGWYAVRTVSEVLGPHPAGLGPSAAEVRGPVRSPEQISALLAGVPDSATAVLDRLVWGPPVGVVSQELGGSDGLRWLLARELLMPVRSDPSRRGFDLESRVLLPREVALVLRGGRAHRAVELQRPELLDLEIGTSAVDGAAGVEVSDLLALVEEVTELWGPAPPRVMRAGGLAVRDLRRLADSLDVPGPRAAWLAEVMLGAGLVADDGDVVPVWAPTPSADDWLLDEPGRRWARLATAWLVSTRAPHLVGSRMGSNPVSALGPDVHWPPIRAMRADVLAILAELPEGHATTEESLLARLRWRRPLRNPARLAAAVAAVLREASWLGVTGRGGLSGPGRELVAGGGADQLAGQMAELLPSPVDHVLVQADLTAVAPGPLAGELAQLMRLTADVESRGGATVHRFTPASVRRALDAGWTADELLDALRRSSRTSVPQPLEYLVRDVARRHGQVRIGGATAYLRSDDEAVLETMLAERGLASLGLRRIAPTVLVSTADPESLLESLRAAGLSPVQERADGSVVVTVAARRRATSRRTASGPLPSTVDTTYAGSLVRGLRSAEESARARLGVGQPVLEPTEPVVTLAALRDAAAERVGVWIGYADMAGRTDRYLFYPARVEGGRAWGRVADSGVERGFSVHRITGVAPA